MRPVTFDEPLPENRPSEQALAQPLAQGLAQALAFLLGLAYYPLQQGNNKKSSRVLQRVLSFATPRGKDAFFALKAIGCIVTVASAPGHAGLPAAVAARIATTVALVRQPREQQGNLSVAEW